MGHATLGDALEVIKRLDHEDLRHVQRVVQERLTEAGEDLAREAFHRALLDSGLVKEIKKPPIRSEHDRPLVHIQGKPLSETIIEERR